MSVKSRYRQTPSWERGLGALVSRLKGMPYENSIHNQAKAKMLRPPTANLAISDLGQYRNAFLAINAYIHSRKRMQIYTFFLKQCQFVVKQICKQL